MTGKRSSDFKIEFFNKENISDELVTNYYTLIDSIWKEIHPYEPLPSKESMKQHFFEPIPNKQTFSWLVYMKDKIVGSCDLVIESQDSPFFEERKHMGQFWMNVHSDYRNNGLGTKLLSTIVKKTLEYDFLSHIELTGATPLKESIAFCEKYNGEVTYEAEENRVYMDDLNWSKIKQVKEQGIKENNDFTVTIFDRIPEELIINYTKAFTELREDISYNDIPEEKRITIERMRAFEEQLTNDKIKWIHLIIRTESNEIIALSELRYHLDSLERINEAFSGVKAQYQNTEIKYLLRSEMLIYIKENFSKVDKVYLWFEHPYMCDVNKEFGFTKHYQGKHFRFTLRDLLTKLNIK